MHGPLDDIPSPCIKVCIMDPVLGLCAGCYRTLDEIAGWADYAPAEKLRVLERIAVRTARLGPPAIGPRGEGGPAAG
ncbi:MAG TPA: DUF1289 domain-containing protein [Burkholderiales bacterium]|nr:DUF1289 domain-containing protein [Burkholderiales bacterium]